MVSSPNIRFKKIIKKNKKKQQQISLAIKYNLKKDAFFLI